MAQKFLPTILLFLALQISTSGTIADEPEHLDSDERITFTTRGGRTFTEVKITRITAYSIVVMHGSGMAQIDFEDLPPNIQAKYQYDPDRASAAKTLLQQQATAARAAYAKERRRYGKFYDHLQSLQAEAVKFTTSSARHSLCEHERNARSRQVRQVIGDHRKKLLRIKQAVADLESQKMTEAQILEHLDAVYDGEVFKGMTRDFALMAWGKPDDVNAIQSDLVDHEQWRYQRSETKTEHLTIIDGKVSEIASVSF